MSEFDFSDEEPVEQTSFDFAVSTTEAFNSQYAAQKAAKYSFALGEDSPGQEVIKGQIEGGELGSLQLSAAQREDARFNDARKGLIAKSVNDVSFVEQPDAAKTVQAIAQTKKEHDPQTILDELYGSRFAVLPLQLSGGEERWKQALNVMPDATLDALDMAGEHIARNEIIADTAEEVNALAANRGWLPFIGDVVEDQFWMWSWAKIQEAFPNHPYFPSESGDLSDKLVGLAAPQGFYANSLFSYLHGLKPSQFKKEWKEGISKLAAHNPMWAQWMVERYRSYSKTDQVLTNFGSAVNPLLLSTWPAMAKGVGKFGYSTSRDIIRQLDNAAMSGADGLFKHTPGSTLIDVDTQKKAIEKALNKPIEQVTPVEVQTVADTAKAVKDTVAAAQEPTVERGLSVLGDIEKSAEAIVHKKAIEKFKGRDPFGDTLDLRNETPSLFNPAKAAGDPGSLSRERAQRIAERALNSAAKLLETVNNETGVVRLPEEAVQAGIEAAKEELRKVHTPLSDAFLDVSHGGEFRVYTPDDQLGNVHTVELKIGKLTEKPAEAAPSAAPVVNKAVGDELLKKQQQEFTQSVGKKTAPTKEQPAAPTPTGDTFIDTLNTHTAKNGRMLIRDLYDKMKAEGSFTGTLGEFKEQIHDQFRKGKVKVTPHKGKIPAPSPVAAKQSIKVTKPEKRYRISWNKDDMPYRTVSPVHLKQMTDRLVTEPMEPVEEVFKRGIGDIKLDKEQKEAAAKYLSNDFDLPMIATNKDAGYTNPSGHDVAGFALGSYVQLSRRAIRRWQKEKRYAGYIGTKFKTANDHISQVIWHEVAHTVIPQGKLSRDDYERVIDSYAYRKTYGVDKPSKDPTYTKTTSDNYISAQRVWRGKQVLALDLPYDAALKDIAKDMSEDELIAYAFNKHRDVLKKYPEATEFVDALAKRVGKREATDKDVAELTAEAQKVELKEPEPKPIEEGNFAAGMRRDAGLGNETLRNRIIDSEGIDLPADKYHSARKYHYVEPTVPVAKQTPPAKKTAFFKGAKPATWEDLYDSLSDMQRMVANTGNDQLYHRLGKLLDHAERQIKPKDIWLGGEDPRKIAMEDIGSPYEDVKRAVPTVQKPDGKTNVGIAPDEFVGGWALSPQEIEQLRLRFQRAYPEVEGQELQRRLRELKEKIEAKRKARVQKPVQQAATEPAKRGKKVIDVPDEGEVRRGSRPLWQGHSMRQRHDAIEREVYDFLKAAGKFDDSFKKPIKDAKTIETAESLAEETVKHLDALEQSGKVVIENKVGKPDATLFKTREQAAYWGRDIYGLSKNSFKIMPQGNGFYISVTKVVDETVPAVRNAMITTENQSRVGFINSFLGMFRARGASEMVSKFQDRARKTATYGPNEARKVVLEASPNLHKLPAKQRDELDVMLQQNRDYLFEDQNGRVVRGKFFDTFGEFERAFHKRFQKLPTDEQIEGYFEYRRLYDLDYTLRNLGLHKELGRLGLEKTRAYFHIDKDGQLDRFPTKWFSSRKIDSLPLHEEGGGDWGVWVYDSNQRNGKFYLRSQLTQEVLDDVGTKTKDHGYSVLELGNPLEKPLQNIIGSDETVNFIVVKDFEKTKYDYHILPYRPGGHLEYENRFFVAQPILRRSAASGSTRHIYEGDMPLLNVSTREEAKRMAEALEEARKLLRKHGEDSQVFKDYTYANTPFEPGHFASFFKESLNKATGEMQPPKLHIDDPISWKFSGRQTVEMPHMRWLENDGQRYPGYFNAVRSKYNLFANGVDKKYLGARDPDLPAVGLSQRGGDEKPMFIDKPPLLDPYPTLEKSLSNVTRSKFLNDYKITATESFIQEFHDVMKTPLEDLRRNPVYYLHNPVWDTETTSWTKLQAAKNSRRAIVELLGTNSELGDGIHWLQQSIGDMVYKTRGQKAANFLAHNKLLPLEKDPLAYARGVAFNIQFWLNPVQWFRQASSFVYSLGIAGPKAAWDAVPRSFMTRMLLATENEDVIRANAQHLAKFSVDPSDFVESLIEFRKSGYSNVGGEYSAYDDYFDPKMFKSKAGMIIDKGLLFFREGERMNRIQSWNIAWSEWRAANPGKVLTNQDRTKILQRADLLGVDMSRAGHASFQNGFGSIPAQWWSYGWRLSEIATGTRLTGAERARLVGTTAAIYGIPAGLSLATFYPWYDDIREAGLSNGYNMDDTAMRFIERGFAGVITNMLTGQDYNTSQVLGPGLQVFKDIQTGDKGLLELALGASGSVIGKTLSSIPGVDAFAPLWDPEAPTPSQSDVVDMARSLAVVNYEYKAYFLATAGKYLNRVGGVVYQSDAPITDAIMHGVFGFTNQKVADSYIMRLSDKQQEAADNIAINEAARYYNLALKAKLAEDTDQFDNYLKKSKAALAAGDIPEHKYSKVIKRAMELDKPMYDRMQKQFIENAHDDVKAARHEMFMEK